MDFWNSNIVATVTGAIVGGIIAIVASGITYYWQRKDAERKEIRENFKYKAELRADKFLDTRDKRVENINVVFCSYKVALDKNGFANISYSKKVTDFTKLRQATMYLENIGKSDINELEVAVTNPKNTALFEKSSIEMFVKDGCISYGVLFDEKIRPGEVIRLNIYYDKDDEAVSLLSASLLIYFRDSLNNICEQPLFLEKHKVYAPRLIDHSEWRERVSVNKNLEHWERHLKNSSKNF